MRWSTTLAVALSSVLGALFVLYVATGQWWVVLLAVACATGGYSIRAHQDQRTTAGR